MGDRARLRRVEDESEEPKDVGTMSISKAVRRKLHELADAMEIDVKDPYRITDPVRVIHRDKGNVVLRGEALKIAEGLIESCAASALRDGGPSPVTIRVWLDRFCVRAHETGVDSAVDWFEERVAQPSEPWLAAEPILILNRLWVEMRVGACSLLKELPERLSAGFFGDPMPDADKESRGVLIAEVLARDEHSARTIAMQHLQEARAILNLLGHRLPEKDGLISVPKSGSGGSYAPEGQEAFSLQLVDPEGKMWSGYHELSLAAGKEEEDRTDWERRCVAAARWFYAAERSSWPSSKLVAAITAGECLLLEGPEEDKALAFAQKGADLIRQAGMSQSQLKRWLRNLYSRRNDAVHAGKSFRKELDADALLLLMRTLIHWAITHLVIWHRDREGSPRQACETYEQVCLGIHSVPPEQYLPRMRAGRSEFDLRASGDYRDHVALRVGEELIARRLLDDGCY
jgi:hypothetical protein